MIAVNGVIGAGISPLDRGFNYGDGLFETIALSFNDQKPCLPLYEYHHQRLLAGCARLSIALDSKKLALYLADILAKASELKVSRGIVKIVVTRGAGGRGYAPPANIEPTVCVGLYPQSVYPAEYFSEGVALHLCHQRLSSSVALAGLKHLNKLECVLARAEWQGAEFAEGIMLDAQGNPVDGTYSNVFLVKAGQLVTPDLGECGVAGVMRRVIIEQLAPALGVGVQIQKISLADIQRADEVFVCNSVYGIWPVRAFNNSVWRPGKVTASLQLSLREYLIEVSIK